MTLARLASTTLVGLFALACGGDDSTSGGGGPGSGGSGGSSAGAGGSSAGTGGMGGSVSMGGMGGSIADAGGSAAGAAGTGGSSGGAAGSGGSSGGAMGYDIYADARESCTFGPGALTTSTIGPNVPHGDALPFDHVVALMLENRSFDHYFSELPAAGVTDVDVASPTETNLDPDQIPAMPVSRFHESRMCIVDVAHHWTEVHLQWNNGAMDGFVSTNNPGGARAMGYYNEGDLPYYYWLSKTFAISDRHFCSLLGPTWPNRFYFYSGTSYGNTKTGDVGLLINNKYQTAPKLMDQLETAGRTWKIYRDGLLSFALLYNPLKYAGVGMDQFTADVANDSLPNVAIIDPSFTGSGQNDEHPPANPQLGQEFVESVVTTVMSNPTVWQKTVIVIFYDEHGGFYDHVEPPAACEPDGDVPPDFRFNRLGIRTPLIVISPFSKAGYVSHTVTDITSVLRFIQNRFDLPAMTARDANAWPMLDMFDFDNPPYMTPPTGAPSGAATQAGIDYCTNNPPGTGLP